MYILYIIYRYTVFILVCAQYPLAQIHVHKPFGAGYAVFMFQFDVRGSKKQNPGGTPLGGSADWQLVVCNLGTHPRDRSGGSADFFACDLICHHRLHQAAIASLGMAQTSSAVAQDTMAHQGIDHPRFPQITSFGWSFSLSQQVPGGASGTMMDHDGPAPAGSDPRCHRFSLFLEHQMGMFVYYSR